MIRLDADTCQILKCRICDQITDFTSRYSARSIKIITSCFTAFQQLKVIDDITFPDLEFGSTPKHCGITARNTTGNYNKICKVLH